MSNEEFESRISDIEDTLSRATCNLAIVEHELSESMKILNWLSSRAGSETGETE